jgi:hypothetical protein
MRASLDRTPSRLVRLPPLSCTLLRVTVQEPSASTVPPALFTDETAMPVISRPLRRR